MTTSEAIKQAYRLQSVWVGTSSASIDNPYDLDKVHASITSELKMNKEMPARCSAGCKRETRAEAILLGKVRKALAK